MSRSRGHREGVLATKGFGRGLEICLWGDWEGGGVPRILLGVDLGRTEGEKEEMESPPLGRQWCV